MPEELQHEDFMKCQNDKFQVIQEYAAPFDLELIQVSNEKAAKWQRMFSVLFRGPSDRFLPQHMYKLKHPWLGEKEIFLVPVGQDQEGFQYEAVFNYLNQPEP